MIHVTCVYHLNWRRGIAAAWRHWNLGHVADPKAVAFPLAAGAQAAQAAQALNQE